MAGDWIKWGKGFLRKPEVVGIANALNVPRETIAASYMRVAEWLDSEGSPDDPDDIDSDITIEILSRNARDNRHALLSHLDEVAELSGMAEALENVDWINLTDTAIVFRRAARHNTETAKRRALASKRQARKRAREAKNPSRKKRDARHANGVTREEKRREENSPTENSPHKPPRDLIRDPDLPECLQTDAFREAWSEWVKHRTEIHKPLKPTQVAAQLRQMADWGEPRAVVALKHTVAKGWQGLREPDEPSGQKPAFQQQRQFVDFSKIPPPAEEEP
jgi:hypothetical protein